MTSLEVVQRAIEFRTPARLPVEFQSLGVTDTHLVRWNQIGTGDSREKESRDEWGCLWVRSDVENMGQIKGNPLHDWSSLQRYRWPDPDNPAFFNGMEEHFRNSEDKYIKTGIFMLLFERMYALRGFENILTDLYLEREKTEFLADRIVEFDIGLIQNISRRFPGQIHGLDFSEDWGTERATFISPELWHEFFGPRYRKIFDAAKNAGWHIWMHSDGRINAILDALIELGVDVINLQQPRVLGIEEIGQRFAGRVCFSTLCDIQHTLPFKNPEAIEEEAKLLVDRWGTDSGGIILSEYGDDESIGVPHSTMKLMYDAFMKHDRWKGHGVVV